jgi:hypothetical protein
MTPANSVMTDESRSKQTAFVQNATFGERRHPSNRRQRFGAVVTSIEGAALVVAPPSS